MFGNDITRLIHPSVNNFYMELKNSVSGCYLVSYAGDGTYLTAAASTYQDKGRELSRLRGLGWIED